MGEVDQLSSKAGSYVEGLVRGVLQLFARLPGSHYIGDYIVKSHQNDPARTVFEILLFLFALHYFFASKQSYLKRDDLQLSEDAVDELVEDWEPLPLVKPLTAEETRLLNEIPVLLGSDVAPVDGADSASQKGGAKNGKNSGKSSGLYVRAKIHEPHFSSIANDEDSVAEKTLLNLSSTDVFGITKDPEVKRLGTRKIKSYGVGSCGPAGFYGNEDVHIECEQAIVEFLGTDAAILYAQGVSTAPSVIPCFAKRGDVLVVDDAINMPVQLGITLSRAQVIYYAHNDIEDLERQLQKSVAMHTRRGRLPRRFIITEGLFEHTGNSPDLKRIIELKKQYKFRLILDESWSIGVLGKSGRGLVEEQNVDRKDIDVTVASLATCFGTYGGFCAGSKAMVEHQRIVSNAYTFSATEPPYLAACTTLALTNLREGRMDARLAALRESAQRFTSILQKSSQIDLISRVDSPMVIFRVNAGAHIDDVDEQAVSTLLHAVVGVCRRNGLLVSRLAQIAAWETFGPVNAIRMFLPAELGAQDVKRTADTIVLSVKQAVELISEPTLA